MSYDMIDRFLRNNLDDDNYAEYSAALDELCTPPAQRPWVGLTHEDIVIILNNDYGGSRADCIRAAEARLKERNT